MGCLFVCWVLVLVLFGVCLFVWGFWGGGGRGFFWTYFGFLWWLQIINLLSLIVCLGGEVIPKAVHFKNDTKVLPFIFYLRKPQEAILDIFAF